MAEDRYTHAQRRLTFPFDRSHRITVNILDKIPVALLDREPDHVPDVSEEFFPERTERYELIKNLDS
jgi:hypothetical protein